MIWGAALLAAMIGVTAQPELDPVPDPRDDPPDTVPEPEPPGSLPEPRPVPEPELPPGEDPTQEEPEDPAGNPSRPPDSRTRGAPNVDVDVSDKSASIDLGGDLIIKPRCNDKGGCNGGRVGFVARFPVTALSPTAGQRATVDALNGFTSSWRLGILGEYLRDATKMDGPSKMYLLTAGVDWGLKTFRYFPDARPGARVRNRHSASALLRFLAYIHKPRRSRVAPQLLVKYDRNWVGAPAVGVILPGLDPTEPIFVPDQIVDGPQTRGVFSATLPVLFSVQRGKRILPQLGFGPTLRFASAGPLKGYSPFGSSATARAEFWLYWYPTGSEGLELQKTNARIGVSPYLDAFVMGRDSDQPGTNVGALIEVKVGVRGYEY